MSARTHFISLLILLAGALGCYFVGLISGVVVFLIAGVILEVSFWLRLFRSRR